MKNQWVKILLQSVQYIISLILAFVGKKEDKEKDPKEIG
jgi:hypothetical protein